MRIHYYKSKEDAQNHVETIENVDWADGFATENGHNDIRFRVSETKEEKEIPFNMFITVVNKPKEEN